MSRVNPVPMTILIIITVCMFLAKCQVTIPEPDRDTIRALKAEAKWRANHVSRTELE